MWWERCGVPHDAAAAQSPISSFVLWTHAAAGAHRGHATRRMACFKCGGDGHWTRDCPQKGGGGGGGYAGGGGGGGYAGGGGAYHDVRVFCGRGAHADYCGTAAAAGSAGAAGERPPAAAGERDRTAAQTGKRSEIIPNYQPSMTNEGDPHFNYDTAERSAIPIHGITAGPLPHMGQGQWCVKARIFERGPGGSNQIRATLFGEDVVEKYYSMMQPGRVLYFQSGDVKQSNKRFTTLPHDCEISFGGHAVIQPAREGDARRPDGGLIPEVNTVGS
eukprot:gene37622-44987_t